MKKSSFIRLLIAYMLLEVTIIATFGPKSVLAAETDSYTHACIKIEDSSDKLNYKLNEILQAIFNKANHDLHKFKQYDDTHAEFYFAYYYYKEMFVDDYGHDAFSPFETCIDTNSCEGWPYFERIYVLPRESIYSEADYNGLTKKYLASNIEACGVRFSTDKLTHMLKDGFKLYNAKKEWGSSSKKIEKYSRVLENTFYGRTSTSVYSNADIVANLNGVRFFEELFSRHVVRGVDGLLKFKGVNICDYVNDRFSEIVSQNIYTEPQAKVAELLQVIEKHTRQCDASKREQILKRKLKPTSVSPAEKLTIGLKNIGPYLSSQDFRDVTEIVSMEPGFQGRKTTRIRKEK